MSTKIIVTGGTIDKFYNPLNGQLEFLNTHLETMLEQSNTTIEYQLETLFLKDSLEMNEQERDEIVKCCKKTHQKKILITHGTDTMVKTAAVLGESIKDKTIVLTGAMTPFRFKNSDALFNLGSALTALEILDCGVYVVMNGKVFSYDNVKKDLSKGVFVSTK